MEPSQPVNPEAQRPEESPEPAAGQPGAPADRPGSDRNIEESADHEPGGDPQDELPRVWHARSIALVILAVVMGLGAGGFVVAYYLYNQAAEPERSTPGVVARQYTDAVFDDRNASAAGKFTCSGSIELSEVQALLADITSRERQFGIRIEVAWEGFEDVIDGNRATVTATGKVQVPERDGQVSESLQRWEFSLEQRSGWRVCRAHRVG